MYIFVFFKTIYHLFLIHLRLALCPVFDEEDTSALINEDQTGFCSNLNSLVER